MTDEIVDENELNKEEKIEKNESIKVEKSIKNNNTIVFNGIERNIIKKDDKLNNILIEVPIINSKGNIQIVQQWVKDIEE